MSTGCQRQNTSSEASSSPSASTSVDNAAIGAAKHELDRKAEAERAFAGVPDEKAWTKAPDTSVTGASSLSCEAKTASEWMRVYCRGKNTKGALPTAVVIVGKSDDVTKVATYESSEDGVALLFAFQAGTHLEAVFTWSDGKRKLTVDWPATGKATFKGAFSSFTGVPIAVPVEIEGTLDHAPLKPIRTTVEDMIANGKTLSTTERNAGHEPSVC